MLRGTALTWKDSTGVTLNPFNATSKSVTDSFIEQMPQLPEEFEKSLFIALGSMRSYPFQQFRKLQCVLLDDKLPWSHSCVEIIVRQTLYQIGELTAEEDPEMLWKTDMLQVNLFTGVVLTDGNAPGGLPANIRVHERFQSLFGRCNFEVNTVNGLFQTESLYCGRLYEFGYHESEELFVQELIVDSRNISGRFQLCSTGWVASFCNHFPRRLRDLYSHWYWVERDCVLFRPKEAKNREVFFIASFDEHNSLRCYQVPFSDTKLTYEYIVTHLKDYDCLVQKDDPIGEVLRVLTKLEDERFLHPLKSPKDTLKIDLPRFKLQFVLDTDMRFASVEHKGYFLASSQQFDDFLPRFSRYLVLELSDKADITRPEVRILLPTVEWTPCATTFTVG
ncbi:hypothetical protein PInf_013524 [Phytophthora infestans]|nr:hypothetical protein PInf_013524 [Phytophthora infestans]